MRGWFKLGPGNNLGTQISSLSGDQGLLKNHMQRTRAFWTITKLGVGINIPENMPIARAYREVCIRDGIPKRLRALLEANDQTLQELSELPHMKPFQKHMPSG